MFHRDFLAPSGSGLGFRGLSPFFSSLFFSGMGHPMFFFAHERAGNMVCCCLGSTLA